MHYMLVTSITLPLQAASNGRNYMHYMAHYMLSKMLMVAVCTGMYNFDISRTAMYPEKDVLVCTSTYHLVLPRTRGTGFQMLPPSPPQPASVDSVPVQIRTKTSNGRKVCNVTRGSAKSTLEISLLSLCFSLLLVTMIVMNSWVYQGPDSCLSAGRRASRWNVQLQAGVRLPACTPPNYTWRQSGQSVQVQGIVSRRSCKGIILHGTEAWQA